MVAFAICQASSIEIETSWIEPLICWLVVGAEKGTGKSPAFGALRAELAEFASMTSKYLDEKDRFYPCLQSFTMESLFPILASASHDGTALCFYDEFNQFLHQMDCYRGKVFILVNFWIVIEDFSLKSSELDKQFWLSLYNGHEIMRTTTASEFSIPQTRVAVCGYIQPKFIFDWLSKDTKSADGFTDRFNFMIPEVVLKKFDELRDFDVTVKPLRKVFFEIWLHQHQHGPFNLKISEEAKTVFTSFYDTIVDRQNSTEDEDLRGIVSKSPALVARLAGLLQILFHFSEDQPSDWKPIVTHKTMGCAVELAGYFCSVKELIFGISGVKPEVKSILEKLDRLPDVFAVREVVQLKVKRGGVFLLKEHLLPILKELVDNDILISRGSQYVKQFSMNEVSRAFLTLYAVKISGYSYSSSKLQEDDECVHSMDTLNLQG